MPRGAGASRGIIFRCTITIVGGRAVAGPVFFGTNPAEVRQGPRKGLRVLAVEEDLGRELMKSLSDEQRKTAIYDVTAPKEIITGNSRKANPGPPVGIAAGDMTPAEQKLLMTLVENYAYRLRSELADDDLAKIAAAGFKNIHFAWAGGLEPGQPHYYRLHGPTFLVEFDNTQNDANHIHTVWRDSANDFGEDLLRQHYDSTQGDAAHGHDKSRRAEKADEKSQRGRRERSGRKIDSRPFWFVRTNFNPRRKLWRQQTNEPGGVKRGCSRRTTAWSR